MEFDGHEMPKGIDLDKPTAHHAGVYAIRAATEVALAEGAMVEKLNDWLLALTTAVLFAAILGDKTAYQTEVKIFVGILLISLLIGASAKFLILRGRPHSIVSKETDAPARAYLQAHPKGFETVLPEFNKAVDWCMGVLTRSYPRWFFWTRIGHRAQPTDVEVTQTLANRLELKTQMVRCQAVILFAAILFHGGHFILHRKTHGHDWRTRVINLAVPKQ
jgi:hypothetical protein